MIACSTNALSQRNNIGGGISRPGPVAVSSVVRVAVEKPIVLRPQGLGMSAVFTHLQRNVQQLPYGGRSARHALRKAPIIESCQFGIGQHDLQAFRTLEIAHA